MPQTNAPFVSVDVGPIAATDFLGLFRQPEGGNSVWDNYYVENRYEENECVVMTGNTSPVGFGPNSDTSSFVQLSSPMLRWVCEWKAARTGEKPKIPDPTPTDTNWVLLGQRLDTESVDLAADGVSVEYNMAGTYYYGYKKSPANILDKMAFPRPSWMQDTTDRTLTTALYEPGISTIQGGSQN